MNGLTESRHNVIIAMLQNIAQKEGIANPKIDLVKGCGKGDGYTGEKLMALVKGDNKSLELFIKGAPTDPAFKKLVDPRLIYLLEILFYKEIYPTYNEFQTRKNIPKPFTSVIGCVDTCSDQGNELLILQNARNLGFELWDRKKQMNSEHVEFIYTEYGKLHGLSYALKDQHPEVHQGLVDKFSVNSFALMADVMMNSCIKIAENIKSQFDPIQEAKVYNAYCKFIDSIPALFERLQNEENKYSVITHGDCWCNNMMFKYTAGSNKIVPAKMCLLDFQNVAHVSPVLDLSYFIYTSSSREVFDNLDHYLKLYLDSLSKTVSDLGSSQNIIPTLAELKNQWKLYGKYGLFMSLIVLKACLQEEDETQELTEAMEENGNNDILAAFYKKIKNDDIYYERLKSIIEHMAENDFL